MNAVIKPHTIQGSTEWHQYRAGKGNASEVAALMGCSPFFPRTPYELWLVKTGRQQVEETPAMRRGSLLEPLVRAYVERGNDVVYEPQVCERGRLSASLDGVDFGGHEVLEIKCPVKGRDSETWAYVAKHDAPPEHYWWQVQQQLLCSGVSRAYFVVAHEEGGEITDTIGCVVLADLQAHTAIEAAWAGFFEHLDSDTPPPLTDKDVEERDDREWRDAAAAWRDAKQWLDEAAKAEKAAKAALQKLAGERSARGAGVKVTRHYVAGGTDYRKAAEDSGADLAQYEKPGRWQYRLTLED